MVMMSQMTDTKMQPVLNMGGKIKSNKTQQKVNISHLSRRTMSKPRQWSISAIYAIGQCQNPNNGQHQPSMP